MPNVSKYTEEDIVKFKSIEKQKRIRRLQSKEKKL